MPGMRFARAISTFGKVASDVLVGGVLFDVIVDVSLRLGHPIPSVEFVCIAERREFHAA